VRDQHLLLVTPGFPADEGDSLCTPPVQLLLEALSHACPELRISVLALHYPLPERRYLWHGRTVQTLGLDNRPWPFRLLGLLGALGAARAFDRQCAITHVHALWLGDAAMTAWRFSRTRRLPLSLTAMGQDVLPNNRYLSLLTRSHASIVAISDRAGKILERSTGRPPAKVIPWGIGPGPEDLLPTKDRPIDVLGVGSLIELKAWDRFLEVIEATVEQGSPLRAVLVGDGPLRPALEKRAESRGLGDRLTFTGELPRPEVLRLMERSRILLHPSMFEGQGVVFDEALSRGMSIVSRSVGGARPSPRWQIGQPETFAGQCLELLRNPPATTPLILHPLEKTVTDYLELWGCWS